MRQQQPGADPLQSERLLKALTIIVGIFAQPLEPVHYAEQECWSDWDLSVGLRYR